MDQDDSSLVQACDFLDKMYSEIDFGKPFKSDSSFEELLEVENRILLKPVFDPVRRKLHTPVPS